MRSNGMCSQNPPQCNFAKWEPCHGKFKLRHPWSQYQKLGALCRECASSMEALSSYVVTLARTEVTADRSIHLRNVLRDQWIRLHTQNHPTSLLARFSLLTAVSWSASGAMLTAGSNSMPPDELALGQGAPRAHSSDADDDDDCTVPSQRPRVCSDQSGERPQRRVIGGCGSGASDACCCYRISSLGVGYQDQADHWVRWCPRAACPLQKPWNHSDSQGCGYRCSELRSRRSSVGLH